MAEEEKSATASGGNGKKARQARKATPRRITRKKAVAPAKRASKAAKKKAARKAGEHPHTNRPRTNEMGVMQAHETPSGVGLEGFRSGNAPKAGSAEAQPNAAGGPPEIPKRAQARRKKVTGHL